MKLTNLIWVLALAVAALGACDAWGDQPPITNEPRPDPGPGPGGTPGTGGTGGGTGEGACTNDADQAVYDAVTFVDGRGNSSSGTAAVSAIASECVRGSVSSMPPVQPGCGDALGAIIGCATASPPNCPPEDVEVLAVCVEDCTQDVVEGIAGETLSQECIDCYGATVSCGAAECAVECVASTTADICVNCRCDAGCTPEFDQCSGFSSGVCN